MRWSNCSLWVAKILLILEIKGSWYTPDVATESLQRVTADL